MKYDSYKSSGIEWLGDVPSHWDIEKVKWIFRHVTEMSEKNNDHELLSVYTDIGVKPRKDLEARGNKASSTDNYWIVKKGDIVVNKLLAWMGAVGLSNYDGVTSPAYDVLRAIKDIDVRYYNYIFRSSQTLSEFKKRSKGIMEMRLRLYFDELGQILFPIPPKEEQKAIADFLDKKLESINNYILKQKELIELLKEKKSSLINRVVTRGLDSSVKYKQSGIEWLGEIPKHWEVKKLSRSFKKIGSGTTPTSNDEKYHKNGTVNWINTGDLNDDYLKSCKHQVTEYALKNVSSLKVYSQDSLIIAMYGATIGKTSISKIEACVNQACCVLSKSDDFEIKFMFYSFIGHRKYILSLSYGGGQPNISQEVIKSLKFCCPPKEEQKQIVNYIEKESKKIDDVISNIEDELKLLDEYKQSIISSAVTGKIKVV